MTLTRTLERSNDQVRRLSGGLQRRVNIAAAILANPKLLVLDEPTVGVDPPARQAIGEVLRDLRAEGVAVLIITHDLDQAGDLADRVGFLNEGLLVMEGAPDALIERAFGDQREVQVEIAGDIDGAQALRLAGEGLERSRSGAWTCLAADAYGLARRLDQRLKAAGLTIREIRVRRASLANLFTLITEARHAA